MSFLKMFSKGFRSSLETSPIDNGTFKVATDTKQLFVDLDGERIELSDVVKGLTESEILDILAPLPKLYLSSDTNKLYNYTTDGWAPVNKNEFIGTRVAVLQAIEDGIIQEGATIYITDDYTGDGADLSIYCTYEYANENLVTKGELSEVTNPEYTKATSVSELSSGELLSVAFGKLAKAIADYISHKADTISHITSAERSKWNAKLGTSDVVNNTTSTDTSKPLSANMGKSLQDQISTLNSKNEYFSSQRCDITTGIGWYRIAKFHDTWNNINGADGNSVGVIIKRAYSNTDNEYHELKLLSVFNRQEFRSIYNKSNVHILTKMRYTVNSDTGDAYIEVYYSTNHHNKCNIILTDRMSGSGRLWENYFEPTEETVDGVIIRTTFDIPSNDT